jgi:hypothetical protein
VFSSDGKAGSSAPIPISDMVRLAGKKYDREQNFADNYAPFMQTMER